MEESIEKIDESIDRMDEYADCSARVALLSSIVAQLEAYENKQSLFGITVTANVRNSWILSLVLVFIHSLWSVVKAQAGRVLKIALIQY